MNPNTATRKRFTKDVGRKMIGYIKISFNSFLNSELKVVIIGKTKVETKRNKKKIRTLTICKSFKLKRLKK
jgi:hypothetical protein